MHKYFAKTLFLGKKIEFLPECHSTNAELMAKARDQQVNEGDVLVTDYQSKGRGQRGNVWLSEPGKNLLFSFAVRPQFLPPRESYFLNVITGLAGVNELIDLLPDTLIELKWPNDIYVSDRKIGGVLIESIIDDGKLESVIVGMGLNINQRAFQMNVATSLYLETDRVYDRESILENILRRFEGYYLRLKSGQFPAILAEYYRVLRWRGELHTFKSGDSTFEGEIIGIDENGGLLVKTNDLMRRFEVKEIEFLY